MRVRFKSNGEEIGNLTWNGEEIVVSDGFPVALLENLRNGVQRRYFDPDDEGITLGPVLKFNDGPQYLAALPTVFKNYYLIAEVVDDA